MLPKHVYYHMCVKDTPEWSTAERTATNFSTDSLLQYTQRMLDAHLTPNGHDIMYEERGQGLWEKGADVEQWRGEQAERIRLQLQEALQILRASAAKCQRVRNAEYPETPYLLWDYERTSDELLDHLSRLHAAGCLEPLAIEAGYPDELRKPLTH